MKLRRSLVTAAATAALVPLALLSAPAAFAQESGSPSAGSSASDDTTTASPSGSSDSSPSGSASESDTSSPSASGSQSGSASGSPSGTSSPSASGSGKSTADPSADEGGFDPYTDCKTFDLDENITAEIKGLPSKIVAGSGWHDFTYEVENNSDVDVKNVYMATYLEYADDTDAWLSEGLAVIQVKEDGKWTDAYQDSYEDEDGKSVNVTGSFVALLDGLEKDSSETLDLRVKVKASAPAGSSFAMSEALYVGDKGDCHINGDEYDVEILAAAWRRGRRGRRRAERRQAHRRRQGPGRRQADQRQPRRDRLELRSAGDRPCRRRRPGGLAAGAVFAARRRKVGTHA